MFLKEPNYRDKRVKNVLLRQNSKDEGPSLPGAFFRIFPCFV